VSETERESERGESSERVRVVRLSIGNKFYDIQISVHQHAKTTVHRQYTKTLKQQQHF